MNNISIISTYYNYIVCSNSNSNININIDNNIYELYKIIIKLQRQSLYLYFYPSMMSHMLLTKSIGFLTKYINYSSEFKSNRNIIYLNFYLIYMIKKYYLNKSIFYSDDFDLDDISSCKKFNTMILNKIVALII